MKYEQIEKAARDLCTTDRQEQWLKDFGTTGFADGARWRIEHEAANIYDKDAFYSLDRIPNTDITPPDDCPYHVKDFKECKYQCETIRPDGNRKINCTCDYFTKNMLIEFGNFKIK